MSAVPGFTPLRGKQLLSIDLSTARGNLWEGAVRSSKTICSIMRWLDYIRHAPPGALLMVGKTERTLKRNVLDVITAMIGVQRCKVRHGAGEATILGRLVYLCGANDEKSADKIKGLTLAGAYGDEVTTWPQSFFTMLLTRLSVEGARWFGTTNPAGPTHWLKRDYLNRARLHLTRDGRIHRTAASDALDIHRFSFQLADNPTLPRAYVDALKQEFVGLFYRRYILGEWVLAEGAVYDMWNPDTMIVPWAAVPIITRWIGVGIDYGITNPTAALLLGLAEDHRLYVVSEWSHDSRRARRQLTDPELSAGVQRWLQTVRWPTSRLTGVTPEIVCVDPSAASFRLQLYRDGIPAMSANNDVMEGIRTVSSVMGADRLRVVDSCDGLIEEIPGYAWDDKATEKGDDAVLKVDDHRMDALRYVAHTTRQRWRAEVLPPRPMEGIAA